MLLYDQRKDSFGYTDASISITNNIVYIILFIVGSLYLGMEIENKFQFRFSSVLERGLYQHNTK
jgi:hypothetical protein